MVAHARRPSIAFQQGTVFFQNFVTTEKGNGLEVDGGYLSAAPWIRTVGCLMSSCKGSRTNRPLASCFVTC